MAQNEVRGREFERERNVLIGGQVSSMFTEGAGSSRAARLTPWQPADPARRQRVLTRR